MAILWADSFDDWTTSSGAAGEYDSFAMGSISTTMGRRGGGCFYNSSNSGNYLQKQLPASYSELFASVAARITFISSSPSCVMRFYSGATAQVSIRVNADGSISATRGTETGTVLGTSAPGLTTSEVYAHYQVRVVFSTTGGVIQVRLNGSPNLVLDLAEQNTTGPSANAVRLTTAISFEGYFDDFVVNDTSGTVANGWLGDVRVDSYFPNANGDVSQMVGSDGNSVNNYQLVSPAAPVSANYTQSAVLGAEDLYGITDMVHTPSAILGVLATAAAKKDDAGARTMRLRARSGGSDAESAADFVLSTSRSRLATLFEIDPSTGLPWTRTALNAAQFGFKISG
jgi:hypothetical protein